MLVILGVCSLIYSHFGGFGIVILTTTSACAATCLLGVDDKRETDGSAQKEGSLGIGW